MLAEIERSADGVGEVGFLRWEQVADLATKRRRGHGNDVVATHNALVIESVR
jgi:hypothetical protein